MELYSKKINYRDLTREKILQQSHLFTVDDVDFIGYSELLTLDEKKDIIIEIFTKEGCTVNYLGDTKIQFKKEKTFSLLWAILFIIAGFLIDFVISIVGLLVYIFYYVKK